MTKSNAEIFFVILVFIGIVLTIVGAFIVCQLGHIPLKIAKPRFSQAKAQLDLEQMAKIYHWLKRRPKNFEVMI